MSRARVPAPWTSCVPCLMAPCWMGPRWTSPSHLASRCRGQQRGRGLRNRRQRTHEEANMNEKLLRDLLGRAVRGEPPLGPVARNALRAGIRLRRRRRAQGTVACAAVLAAAVFAVPALTGTSRPGPALPAHPAPPARVVYVGNLDSGGPGSVTPITIATNTPGKPIAAGRFPLFMAVTPDGKTVYVSNNTPGTVTPINTATNKPGTAIKIGPYAAQIAFTPDGRTAYVITGGPQ